MFTHRGKVVFLLALASLALGVVLVIPPFPQPLWYHDFADQRCFFCIPHTLNVVSNLPFLVVGIWGLVFLTSARASRPGVAFLDNFERWAYVVFFLGIALTGLGSAYYHADPTNDRLLWDRLPLAVAFMGLFCAVLSERLDPRLGRWLLWPLVLIGAGSVVYWHWTESLGRGDLRPYLLVQFLPLVALPILLLLFPARYTRTQDLVGALSCYVLAKILELLDAQVYTGSAFVSGHTLKHLAAAIGPLLILHMLRNRRPIITA